MRSLSSLISLYHNTNKNFFFEKYKFINLKERNKKRFFCILFLFRNQLLPIISLIFIELFFRNEILNLILVTLYLLSIFLKIDNTDWKLFERNDFVLAHPEIGTRFVLILSMNFIYKFIVENNLFILLLLLQHYLRLSEFYIPILLFGVLVLFFLLESYFFVIQFSTLLMKKIVSIFQYLFSNVTIVIVTIAVLEGAIVLLTHLIESIKNQSVFFEGAFKEDFHQNISHFLNENVYLLALFLAFIFLVTYVIIIFSLKKMSRSDYLLREDGKYVLKNFGLVKFLSKNRGKLVSELQNQLVNKEFQLFSSIYKYQFKNYFYILLLDRPSYILMVICYFIKRSGINGSSLILLSIVPLMLVLDISSSIGVKLVVNMSFITDYGTIRLFNTNYGNIDQLIKAKIHFFYTIKLFSLFLFFLIFNFIAYQFGMNNYLKVLLNIICVYIVCVFPRYYLINNLIYTRLNYKDYILYLEDSSILEEGVSDFMPLNLFLKTNTILSIGLLIFLGIFNYSNIFVLTSLSIVIQVIVFVLCYITMNRVLENIISYIERGDYSADFSKIFKR